MKLKDLFLNSDSDDTSTARRGGDRITRDTEGASSLISIILIVAVSIIMASMVAVFGLSFFGTGEQPPNAAFEADYDAQTGQVVLKHRSGDPIKAKKLEIKGAMFGDIRLTGDDEIESGDTIRLRAENGDEITVNWVGTQETKTLLAHKVEARGNSDRSVFLDWNRAGKGDRGAEFFGNVRTVEDEGMHWRAKNDHIEIADGRDGGSWGINAMYSVPVPDGHDTVTVDFDFAGDEFADSGMELVVEGTGGEKVLACDNGDSSYIRNCGGTTIADDSGDNHEATGNANAADTPDFGPSTWTDVDPSGEVERVYVKLHMHNSPGTFYDEAKFYRWKVEP